MYLPPMCPIFLAAVFYCFSAAGKAKRQLFIPYDLSSHIPRPYYFYSYQQNTIPSGDILYVNIVM